MEKYSFEIINSTYTSVIKGIHLLTDEKNPRAAGPKKKVIHYKQEENSLNRHLAPLASSQNKRKAYIFFYVSRILNVFINKLLLVIMVGTHTKHRIKKAHGKAGVGSVNRKHFPREFVPLVACLKSYWMQHDVHFLNYSSHLESNKTLACKRPVSPNLSVKSVLRSSDRVSKHPNGDSKITQLDTSNRSSLTSGWCHSGYYPSFYCGQDQSGERWVWNLNFGLKWRSRTQKSNPRLI